MLIILLLHVLLVFFAAVTLEYSDKKEDSASVTPAASILATWEMAKQIVAEFIPAGTTTSTTCDTCVASG